MDITLTFVDEFERAIELEAIRLQQTPAEFVFDLVQTTIQPLIAATEARSRETRLVIMETDPVIKPLVDAELDRRLGLN